MRFARVPPILRKVETKRYTASGGIIIRGGQALLLHKHKKDEYVLPKGHVEPGEELMAAAVRELEEEAAVDGVPLLPVGYSSFRSGREDIDVTYFLVRALTEGQRREGRQLAWLPYEQARARLTFPDSRRLLDEALGRLRG